MQDTYIMKIITEDTKGVNSFTKAKYCTTLKQQYRFQGKIIWYVYSPFWKTSFFWNCLKQLNTFWCMFSLQPGAFAAAVIDYFYHHHQPQHLQERQTKRYLSGLPFKFMNNFSANHFRYPPNTTTFYKFRLPIKIMLGMQSRIPALRS